ADRQYQIAAAHFYALHYDEARARFLAIARDAHSPWQKVARLVAVRALIRAENLGVAIADDDPLATADRELHAILADPSMQPLHDAAWDLLAVTTLRRDPQQRFADAAKALLGGETSARRVRVQLGDYTLLWDKDVTGNDELTNWIRTFQSGDLAHAVERWQATKGTHWLVAALAHVPLDDRAVASLLEASKSIAHDSPAAPTIAYHRARLFLGAERYDEARAEVERAIALDLPLSARNRVLVQRRALARSLEEYLRDVPVKAVAYGVDLADAERSDPTLPTDAAVVLNYWMPLETLVEAALSDTLPENLRTAVRDAAWTRALLLDRADLAKKLDPETETRTRFDVAYALTRTTSSDPYVEPLGLSFGEWWCKGGPPYLRDDSGHTLLPRFLDREDTADAEATRLYEMGAGATWIFRQLLARAKSHPDDPRVPESLSLAIKATRHACGDKDTTALAKQAFQLLHRRYAKTKWAEETPYWYEAH
ncbi:MAG TPA: hypothetical protein VHK90_12280, partial [Thermoanaerobaculia bacterium]|nr:hypothetical protein [Thermoanaerobaculia bacterium]